MTNRLQAFHFWLLVCPQRLSFDWSMDSIPLISRLDDWRNLATLCFYSALFRIIRKSSNRDTNQTCGLLVALMTIPFIPATNLFVYVGFVAAERILYLPSAGFCLLIACGWDRIRKFRRQEALCSTLALAVVTLMTCRTLRRNADWSDEEALYRSAIRINPPKGNPHFRIQKSSAGPRREGTSGLLRHFSRSANQKAGNWSRDSHRPIRLKGVQFMEKSSLN